MKISRSDLHKFDGLRLLVLGDLMMDRYLKGTVTRISPEAPVPVVNVRSNEVCLGGAGNVISNLHALGANIRVSSCIGQDDAGTWIVEKLQGMLVDTSFIYRSQKKRTNVKTRIVAQNQQLLRYDEENKDDVPEEFADWLQNVLTELTNDIDTVIISDYGKGVVRNVTAQTVIKHARDCGINVIVDPKGSDYSKYKGATVCTPNMKELSEAVGKELHDEQQILDASLSLCNAFHLDNVLATRSEKGMSFICGESKKKFDFPAIAKEVVDVTGAGDTVVAVFSMGLAVGFEVDFCCRLANLAASIVVSKFGTAVVTREELYEAANQATNERKKILSAAEAAQYAEECRKAGKKIVFSNGCFDLVHAGHISSFIQAKKFGDILFLGVNSDTSVKRLKGESRPIVDEGNRLALLDSIKHIDVIVLFDEDTPQALVEQIKPDIIVKGKDWQGKIIAGGDFVESRGGEVKFIDMEDDLSTTEIIDKINQQPR